MRVLEKCLSTLIYGNLGAFLNQMHEKQSAQNGAQRMQSAVLGRLLIKNFRSTE
jgi:hypothetical protein